MDPSLIGIIRDGGLVVGLIVLVWLLLTDRLITPARLKDALDRLAQVEKVRDEALKGWKEQAAATKEVADKFADLVALVRENLPPRQR